MNTVAKDARTIAWFFEQAWIGNHPETWHSCHRKRETDSLFVGAIVNPYKFRENFLAS